MSVQCKLASVPLERLDPFFVEIHQPGALRRIRPTEKKEAQGFCFLCPRCKDNKKKRHYLIFLFHNAPEKARPGGRFRCVVNQKQELRIPKEQSVIQSDEASEGALSRTLLRPQDVCGWEGYVQEGKVSWKPNMLERLRGM